MRPELFIILQVKSTWTRAKPLLSHKTSINESISLPAPLSPAIYISDDVSDNIILHKSETELDEAAEMIISEDNFDFPTVEENIIEVDSAVVIDDLTEDFLPDVSITIYSFSSQIYKL